MTRTFQQYGRKGPRVDDDFSDEELAVSPVPVKRPRGRPPKNRQALPLLKSTSDSEAPHLSPYLAHSMDKSHPLDQEAESAFQLERIPGIPGLAPPTTNGTRPVPVPARRGRPPKSATAPRAPIPSTLDVDEARAETGAKARTTTSSQHRPPALSIPTSPRRAQSTPADIPLSSPSRSKAYDILLAKYEELRTMRLTDAERQFQVYRKSVEERFAATEALINTLTEQLEEAQGPSLPPSDVMHQRIRLMEARLEEANARARTPGKPRPAPSSGPLIRDLEDAVKLFEELTGLEITRTRRPEGLSFECVQTGRNGMLSFRLTRPTDHPSQLDYTPLIHPERDAHLLTTLPAYLQDEICFQKESASLFFWRLLNYLQTSA